MNDSKLTYDEITPYEASAYMDDYLLNLVGVDHADACTVGAAGGAGMAIVVAAAAAKTADTDAFAAAATAHATSLQRVQQ